MAVQSARKQEDSGLRSGGGSRGEDKRLNRKWGLAIAAFLLLLGAMAGYAFVHWSHGNKAADYVELSGRIEADSTYLSAPIASKVASVKVKEGEHVRKGQLVATLDSSYLRGKISRAGQAVSRARAVESQASQLEQAAEREAVMLKSKSRAAAAAANPLALKAQLAGKAVDVRKEILTAKLATLKAKGAVAKAESLQEEAKSKLSLFRITSPVDGICEVRCVNAGDLVDKGDTVITIIDPKAAYMRGYIPEGDLSKVKLGQKADVFLDEDDKSRRLAGHLSEVDAKPSFTPRDVYFKDDRIRQAFGLKIALEAPDGFAKPGMRADARIYLHAAKRE